MLAVDARGAEIHHSNAAPRARFGRSARRDRDAVVVPDHSVDQRVAAFEIASERRGIERVGNAPILFRKAREPREARGAPQQRADLMLALENQRLAQPAADEAARSV